MELHQHAIKDLGLQCKVLEALPYAVVGGTWEGSFLAAMAGTAYFTALNHIVPHGQQLKILFLRVWTQEQGGARFSIVQTNPSAVGQTGAVEAYPVVGNVPPFIAGASETRDYPMLEAPGAEMAHASLIDPVHVLEGSVDFRILAQYPGAVVAGPATGARYCIAWWGVEKIPK